MVIYAYSEAYLDSAKNILGHAVDFAVMSLNIEPDTFGDSLMVSNAAAQFGRGNPSYVAGTNGCELARQILNEAHIDYADIEDAMYLDKSPEYWAGWALAHYQWYSSRSFMEILTEVPLSEMIKMYPVYHEMDIEHFLEHMNVLIKDANPTTKLRAKRLNCNMSQSELAKDSGVALRQIQLFEQRQRDINNASAITLLRLSRSLNCRMEDLIEL
ncbi:MAG: helix-turn-helix transcriptional regulator [Clostridiales bacterium]|nr:helix-turn-helix transcriptional regulator [Clostridiales bacterium]